MLTYADRHALAYRRRCTAMQTYVDGCSRVLTCAAETQSKLREAEAERERARGAHNSAAAAAAADDKVACMLTYADVCCRMLTYADVC